MAKVQMGQEILLYPLPIFLIGADVDGKPNFMAAGACGIANTAPPMLSIAVRPHRYTHKGISQNLTFSVNVPSVDLIREADYCGIISGAKVNKVEACHFSIFYGKLGTAPLIEQCPINLECKVVKSLKLDSHTLFIGKIEEAHISENCLTDGKPDVKKIKPVIYTRPTHQYQAFGEIIAKSHSIGREIRDLK